jgi:hypothetical protein
MSDLLVDIGVAVIGGAIAFGLLPHLRATLNKSLAAQPKPGRLDARGLVQHGLRANGTYFGHSKAGARVSG